MELLKSMCLRRRCRIATVWGSVSDSCLCMCAEEVTYSRAITVLSDRNGSHLYAVIAFTKTVYLAGIECQWKDKVGAKPSLLLMDPKYHALVTVTHFALKESSVLCQICMHKTTTHIKE